MSALLIAYGLCGDWTKVAVIDTENNSADLYSHLGAYNVLPLPAPYAPERYIEAIKACEEGGMDVIIIDSIAHEWEGEGGVLQLCDSIGGGFQTAWKQMTPRHDKFKNAILSSTCHVITTVRRKQEYILVDSQNSQGKTVQKPVKAGMKEITREGWEYELTVNLELDIKHECTASKDRTGLFMGKDPFIPTVATGQMIKEWCDTGADIENEINIAINQLSQCNDADELTILGEGQPDYVRTAKRFRAAAGIRFNEIKALQTT